MTGCQGKGFSCVAATMAMLVFVAANDHKSILFKRAYADTRAEAYFAAHPGPFCAFQGVWYDWEQDETITLGCLEVKPNIRAGSYSSAMGPRATSNFTVSGTYDIDPDSAMLVAGKDREGKNVEFTRLIYVEDKEYPTQMIVVDEKGGRRVYIWQRNFAE